VQGDHHENQNFMTYSPPRVSNKAVKSVGFYHDNDLFPTGIKNEDRNYTGGGRLFITTDLFKLRLFDFFKKSNVLSYQTLFVGGEAYTPRVQYNSDLGT
jgi:hypothetical protein